MYTIQANNENEHLCGGWEETDLQINQELLDIFNQAAPNYTPIKLIGRQVVAGINYKFEALDKDNKKVIIVIYQDLDGNCSIKE